MSFDGYFWLGVLELLGRGMSQDQASGAAGNAFGREMAPRIANAIGAVMLGSRSNEATYGANRIVIKCAAPNTSRVASASPTSCSLRCIPSLARFSKLTDHFGYWLSLHESTLKCSAPLEVRAPQQVR